MTSASVKQWNALGNFSYYVVGVMTTTPELGDLVEYKTDFS